MKKEDLKKLYKAGLITAKPFNYFEIKSKVQQYTTQGATKTESVVKVAALLGVSSQTVWNALKATNGIELI